MSSIGEIAKFRSSVQVNTINEFTSASGVTVDGVRLKDSQVYTDTINELTSASGVTVDSVLLKDGNVSTLASGTVTMTYLQAKDTQSFALKNSTGTSTLTVTEAGVASFYGTNINVVGPSSSGYLQVSRSTIGGFAFSVGGSGGCEIYGSDDSSNPAKTITGSYSAAGAWTWGPTSGANVGHYVYSSRASTSSGNIPFGIFSTAAAADQKFLECFYSGATTCGGLARSASTQNITLYNGSDRRIKTNISEPVENGHLEKIKAVKLRTYDWKSGATGGFGPIAQELHEVYPNKVVVQDDGLGEDLPENVSPWCITDNWQYELMVAIKEQQAMIEAQSQAIEELKAKVAALELRG